MPDILRHVPKGFPRVVVFSRGDGLAEMAGLLATDRTARADSDLLTSCISNRADLVVTAAHGAMDAISSVTPIEFDRHRVQGVVAAISGGPHSRLAARMASRLGKSLGVPTEAVSGYRNTADKGIALRALAAAEGLTGISARSMQVKSASDLIESLDTDTLLVMGAAGGSWLQRQFFGPGARLTRNRLAGTVIVRSSPVRAFQCMADLDGYGTRLRAEDAIRLSPESVIPVVDDGVLVGVARRTTLLDANPDAEIGDLAETAPLAYATDTVEDLIGLASFFDGSPIPVVDREGRLAGGVILSNI